jgi:PAS domain S-box-containing protein
MLNHLSPGEHLCHFYDNDTDRQIIALNFIKQGVAQGEFVVVFGLEPHGGLLASPNGLPLDGQIETALENGKLVVFSKTIEERPDDEFDVDQFTDWLTRAAEITVQCAENQPNICVRVLAQMDCILPGTTDTGQLETYEDLVHQYFMANHCIVLCQYNRQIFSPQQLLEALLSHPTLVINHEIHKNFYYTPPANKSEDDLALARFDQWVKNLLLARETEEELILTHTWIEGASDMVFWIDENGQIVYANSTACERLRYTRNELLERSVHDIEPIVSIEGWKKQWQMLKEKGSITQEAEVVTRSGQSIPVEIKRNFLLYSGFEYSCAIAHDISEHKQRERLQKALYQISEAANSAKTQQELFENVHEIVATLIPARNLYISLYDSASGTVSFPYYVDEYDSRPAPRKGGKGLTEFLIKTGRPLFYTPDSDFNIREHDILYMGTYSPSWMGVPLKNANGRIIGSLVVQSYDYEVRYNDEDLAILTFVSRQIANTIERQQTQENLQRSEENFRMLVEGIKDYAAFMLDVNGNVISWNSGAERLEGYKAHEIIGNNVAVFYLDADQEHNLPRFELSLAARKGSFEHESWRLRRDGSKFYANVVINALYDQNGEVYGYIEVVRDVSTRAPGENPTREHRLSVLDDF